MILTLSHPRAKKLNVFPAITYVSWGGRTRLAVSGWAKGAHTTLKNLGVWVISAKSLRQKKVARRGIEPNWARDGDHIAYTKLRRQRWPIVSVKPDGSDRQVVSHPPLQVRDETPTWSPDGSKIAFVRDYGEGPDGDEVLDLCVVNADGSNLLVLEHLKNGWSTRIAWSPDSQQIAFSVYEGLAGHLLHVINADGSGDQEIGQGYEPDWQPLAG